jgi:hypothetical protein
LPRIAGRDRSEDVVRESLSWRLQDLLDLMWTPHRRRFLERREPRQAGQRAAVPMTGRLEMVSSDRHA